MSKKLAFFLYKILKLLDRVFAIVTKRNLVIWFKDFIEKDSYTSIQILNKKINFFTPNELTRWRIKTFFSKEPETIQWIDNFNINKKTIFWDIGSNIGIFSIYNAIKNKNSQTVSFEPSTSNLRILSRNIFINKLQKKIIICPIPLTRKDIDINLMQQNNFIEGGGLNTFAQNFNFEGKKLYNKNMSYSLIGININFLLKNKILEVPDYIKIDVDGIEHLIIEGANKFLKNRKIKSILIEINDNFLEQKKRVLAMMKRNDFKLILKQNSNLNIIENKFTKTYNYIFSRDFKK